MIAIRNGKVVTVTGETYEKADILVENGKIKAIGENLEIPENAEIIDAKGMWVTPGLIDCHTHISNFNEPRTMPSIPLDGNEMSSPITPQVRAIDAVNPYDYAIDVVRKAGFSTVCILPGSANLIGGMGTVIKLRDVETAEEMVWYDFSIRAKGRNRRVWYNYETESYETCYYNITPTAYEVVGTGLHGQVLSMAGYFKKSGYVDLSEIIFYEHGKIVDYITE